MSTTRNTAAELRSARWFAPDDLRGFGTSLPHHADGLWPRGLGRPAGHRHHQHLVRHQSLPRAFQASRRGREARHAAGRRLPDRAAGASRWPRHFVKPTTMLYRNMLAMDAEELIRSHPVDGVVLMGGCDKTTPALLMGATSAGLPAIYRAGRTDAARQLEGQGAGLRLRRLEILGRAPRRHHHATPTGSRSRPASPAATAHCMTMGTATTMTAIAEAIGMTLPGRLLDSRRRCQPYPHVRRMPAGASSRWSGKT